MEHTAKEMPGYKPRDVDRKKLCFPQEVHLTHQKIVKDVNKTPKGDVGPKVDTPHEAPTRTHHEEDLRSGKPKISGTLHLKF